jgi:hypothetical protein
VTHGTGQSGFGQSGFMDAILTLARTSVAQYSRTIGTLRAQDHLVSGLLRRSPGPKRSTFGRKNRVRGNVQNREVKSFFQPRSNSVAKQAAPVAANNASHWYNQRFSNILSEAADSQAEAN